MEMAPLIVPASIDPNNSSPKAEGVGTPNLWSGIPKRAPVSIAWRGNVIQKIRLHPVEASPRGTISFFDTSPPMPMRKGITKIDTIHSFMIHNYSPTSQPCRRNCAIQPLRPSPTSTSTLPPVGSSPNTMSIVPAGNLSHGNIGESWYR